ncbi:unnamed protein product, partial [Symbiodinium sp. CCMP2456]
RKAELMLMALPNTYSKEKWGAKLMELLSGEAEEVCETIPVEKLIKEGGHELVLKALDDKYQELEKDALHKHLTEYFYGVSIKGGETYRNLMVRLETSYRRLQEHKVELPEEVRGWFLLRKLGVEATAEAMILTHTKGSLKYPEVSKAVQDIFPQGFAKNTSSKVKEVFEVDNDTEAATTTEEDDVNEVYQAVADQVQNNPEYDDEDALDVFETYKEVRKQVQQRKLGRGYKPYGQRPEWTLTGTVKGRIEQLKMKTKCHGCGERGHWKKECPKRKSAGSGTVKEAMVADEFQDTAKSLEQEFFLDEENIDQLEVFLAEQDGQLDVVVASKGESLNDDGEVRGDFEQGLMKFFSMAHDSDAKSSEAYMADLASHGVPDTACRRTLIGESVLSKMSDVLSESGLRVREIDEEHEFRFGNAGVLRTTKTALIPISLGGKRLAIKAAVLPQSGAQTPLLLSKELMRGLKAKIDLENDRLVVGKYGVVIPLKETDRGHYALPLFEGFKKHKDQEGVSTTVSTKHAQTLEVNAVENKSVQAFRSLEDDVPMISELVVKTPLVERLVADLAPQLQGGTESATLAATILDAASDHSDDEPEGLVSGLSGDLVLNVGKYEKLKMAMKFSTAYCSDKKYIAWVRKFIKDKESKSGKSENHPTMGLFRLYIELRDQVKSRRIRTSAAPRRSPMAGYASSSQAPLMPTTGPMSKAKSKSRSAPTPATSQHEWSTAMPQSEWLVMPSAEPEPVDAAQARRMKIQQKIEALTHELEALDELADL